jgi:hypothetical protein
MNVVYIWLVCSAIVLGITSAILKFTDVDRDTNKDIYFSLNVCIGVITLLAFAVKQYSKIET